MAKKAIEKPAEKLKILADTTTTEAVIKKTNNRKKVIAVDLDSTAVAPTDIKKIYNLKSLADVKNFYNDLLTELEVRPNNIAIDKMLKIADSIVKIIIEESKPNAITENSINLPQLKIVTYAD